MNSSEIYFILKSLTKTKDVFLGVYACDTLPKVITKRPAILICNTQPIKMPGEHWIAMYISKKKHGQYFDSFGLPPNNKKIIGFLKKHCVKYDYNKQMIQSLFSNYCGQFCIMYTYYKALSKSLKSFIKIFNLKKLSKNNQIVFNFF